MKKHLDRLDKQILSLISCNARLPFLDVARKCNVSGAAIHQRVQKLLQAGVLKGSQFIVDTNKIGYNTCAFLGVMVQDMARYREVIKALSEIPEVVECHSTTGRYSLLIKLYAHTNRDLRDIIVDRISLIPGISGTETLHISLDEIFNRQIAAFDDSTVIFDD
ncbi:MAG: Lrp/AsnC ligand binding domain-containing protein [Paludibacteraceae bacterium]|nr:Lrp/AsnC ligand binding domain-containing protein [Paludibacteraceae bacterium]